MTQEKDVNIEIATFIGPDPYTLRNMGKICPAFEGDVAEFLQKAIVHVIHVKKMEVMEELLAFARGGVPILDGELWEKMCRPEMIVTILEAEKIRCFRKKYIFWEIMNMNLYEYDVK